MTAPCPTQIFVVVLRSLDWRGHDAAPDPICRASGGASERAPKVIGFEKRGSGFPNSRAAENSESREKAGDFRSALSNVAGMLAPISNLLSWLACPFCSRARHPPQTRHRAERTSTRNSLSSGLNLKRWVRRFAACSRPLRRPKSRKTLLCRTAVPIRSGL